MKLEFAFFADNAEVTDRGVFSVLGGGYDEVRSAGFPATKASLALVMRLLVTPEECKKEEHKLYIQIVDPNGAKLPTELRSAFKVSGHPRDPGKDNRMTIVGTFNLVTLQVEGKYTFRILINGEEVGQVALEAVRSI